MAILFDVKKVFGGTEVGYRYRVEWALSGRAGSDGAFGSTSTMVAHASNASILTFLSRTSCRCLCGRQWISACSAAAI